VKRIILSLMATMGSAYAAADEMITQTVSHTMEETTFESTLVWPAGTTDPLPGILMVPNWMGPTAASLEKAKEVAEEGFVVMMADVYGTGVRPTNAQEASKAAGALRGDRGLMRARGTMALDAFRSAEGVPLKREQIAAIGFCFGGGAILELGRTGADLDAIISFHGDLLSPTLEADAGATKAAVLVLHGAADPYVPQAHVQEWIEVMSATKVDWQLIQLSGAVHSFTDPLARSVGKAHYNPTASARAFEYMDELLEELWELDDDEMVKEPQSRAFDR
jgi:dienelactone hydrolase